MPEVRYWSDVSARRELVEKGREAFERIKGQLQVERGVVAIEVDSGDHFVGTTLGRANEGARVRYPDRWLYFRRLDDPKAEMILPTW
jgi:hypothetical protein